MLDDLVGVITKLQGRIRDHGDVLRQNEIRTRVALIDPLLQALGWDVADFTLVMPEYNVGGSRPDYALLGNDGKPQAFIEAKKLDETLESSRNVDQVFTYALTQQVKYAGLTDGNRWVFDDVSDFSGSERRKLSVSLSGEPAYQLALKLLLLWRPNLVTGEPVTAADPLFVPARVEPAFEQQSSIPPSEQTPGQEWIPLAAVQTGGNVISGPAKELRLSTIRLPDGRESSISNWWHVPREVAEYLIRTGNLTSDHCPLGERGKAPVVTAQRKPDAKGNFYHIHELSNGCFLTKSNTGAGLVNGARFLLQHCGVDAGAVWLRLNP